VFLRKSPNPESAIQISAMKLLASFCAGGIALLLMAVLGVAIFLDLHSAEHLLHVSTESRSKDGAVRFERFVQFTNRPGELMFGYKMEPAHAFPSRCHLRFCRRSCES